MTPCYLAYDIKGIQNFIFSVPRLKCVIGASSQIADFDHDVQNRFPSELVFCGGGRGVILCSDTAQAQIICNELVGKAHGLGLDLRIAIDADFLKAIGDADQLYPFCPADLAGQPCDVSGLWPVATTDTPSTTHRQIHPLIAQRLRLADAREGDHLWKRIFDRTKNQLFSLFPGDEYNFEGLRNVSPEPTDDDNVNCQVDQQRARAGRAALGGQNRWAVIAMDGNDLGRHFRQLCESAGFSPKQLQIASSALKELTFQSCCTAFLAAIQHWLQSCHPNLDDCTYTERQQRYLVLPFRPLILGGDDVVLLCHSSLAIPFVRTMVQQFAAGSLLKSTQIRQEHSFQPFPAGNGSLSISAGVLFCKVSLPLHVAIPYAQSLLKNSKAKFRQTSKPAEKSIPTPAAIDWDCVTDSILDSPAARRERDLCFLDQETRRVVALHDRPCQLNETGGLSHSGFDAVLRRMQHLTKLPASFRAELRHRLPQVWSERTQFLLSAAKDQANRTLVDSLLEDPTADWATAPPTDSAWRIEKDSTSGIVRQFTNVLDAVLLLEEGHRMGREVE